MPSLARISDKDNKGHPIVKASSTVMSDNLYAANKGSKMIDGDIIFTGSSSVNIENQPAAIVSSKTVKGHIIIKGSSTITIGL